MSIDQLLGHGRRRRTGINKNRIGLPALPNSSSSSGGGAAAKSLLHTTPAKPRRRGFKGWPDPRSTQNVCACVCFAWPGSIAGRKSHASDGLKFYPVQNQRALLCVPGTVNPSM